MMQDIQQHLLVDPACLELLRLTILHFLFVAVCVSALTCCDTSDPNT